MDHGGQVVRLQLAKDDMRLRKVMRDIDRYPLRAVALGFGFRMLMSWRASLGTLAS